VTDPSASLQVRGNTNQSDPLLDLEADSGARMYFEETDGAIGLHFEDPQNGTTDILDFFGPVGENALTIQAVSGQVSPLMVLSDNNENVVHQIKQTGEAYFSNTVTAAGYMSGSASAADDSAHSLTPAQSFGKIVIQDGNGEVAEFLFDVSNGAITKVSDLGGNFETSTSSLSGTTGTDGKITVSADASSGELDIENRIGSSRTFRWHIVG